MVYFLELPQGLDSSPNQLELARVEQDQGQEGVDSVDRCSLASSMGTLSNLPNRKALPMLVARCPMVMVASEVEQVLSQDIPQEQELGHWGLPRRRQKLLNTELLEV